MANSAVRAYIYSLLKHQPDLALIVGGRVFQQGSLISAQQGKPYLVYHFGHMTDEGMSDPDSWQPSRQYLEIYIHVDIGDYGPIDDLMPTIRAAMDSLSVTGRPPELIHAQYLETSQDLQDNLLQTFFRYMRFQLILSR